MGSSVTTHGRLPNLRMRPNLRKRPNAKLREAAEIEDDRQQAEHARAGEVLYRELSAV